LGISLFASCATQKKQNLLTTIDTDINKMSLSSITQIAVKTMEHMGYLVTVQNEDTGYVYGTRMLPPDKNQGYNELEFSVRKKPQGDRVYHLQYYPKEVPQQTANIVYVQFNVTFDQVAKSPAATTKTTAPKVQAPAVKGLEASVPFSQARGQLGVIVENKTKDRVNIVEVVEVIPDSAAQRAGLMAGDVILKIDGKQHGNGAETAHTLGTIPRGKHYEIEILRKGEIKYMTVVQGAVLKATVAVGDFQVKAAKANDVIGDGLREMLQTELFKAPRLVVLERTDIQGLAAEQELSRSELAKASKAIPKGRMDVADIYVYGTVTEFEPEMSGKGGETSVPGVPLKGGTSEKVSHLAIDVRVVDVASGRLVGAERIAGTASYREGGGGISLFGIKPLSLSAFNNTPMELAIRRCIQSAVGYVHQAIPGSYFRHE